MLALETGGWWGLWRRLGIRLGRKRGIKTSGSFVVCVHVVCVQRSVGLKDGGAMFRLGF